MSLTYLASITQFLVVMGILTQAEAQTLSDGVVALMSLAALIVSLYGRWRAGGLDWLGFRKYE